MSAASRDQDNRQGCVHLTEATVKSHLGRVLAKVGARDRVQLVIFAYANGVATASLDDI